LIGEAVGGPVAGVVQDGGGAQVGGPVAGVVEEGGGAQVGGSVDGSGEDAGEGLVDGVLLGDGERAFPRFLEVFGAWRADPRERLLERLRAEVRGFYDPEAYRQVFDGNGRLAAIEPRAGAPFPVEAHRARDEALDVAFTGGPLFYEAEAAGVSHLLISAGCPYFCSFCKESWEQKPYRERSAERLLAAATALKANLGLRELNLMTFNANTVSRLGFLLDRLEPLFERVSLKSQRFDAIVSQPRLLERQLAAGKRTYTCAMEGISDRLRRYLRKNLDGATLLAGFRELFRRNVRQMKIFLIVTGREDEGDLAEFDRFLGSLQELLAPLKGKPVLTFSLAALYRPPHTPLQFEPRRRDGAALEAAFAAVSRAVSRHGFECRSSAGPADALLSEFLSYGDRRLTPVLVQASLARGFRYRGEVEAPLAAFFREEIRRRGLPPFEGKALEEPREAEDRQTHEGPAGPTAPSTVLPWDDVDTGIGKAFLWKEYQALLADREGKACLAPPLGSGVCLGCGACRTEGERRFVTGLTGRSAPDGVPVVPASLSVGPGPATAQAQRPVAGATAGPEHGAPRPAVPGSRPLTGREEPSRGDGRGPATGGGVPLMGRRVGAGAPGGRPGGRGLGQGGGREAGAPAVTGGEGPLGPAAVTPAVTGSTPGGAGRGQSLGFRRWRVACRVPRRWSQVSNEFLGAALGRAIMLGKPAWVEGFRAFTACSDRLGTWGHATGDFLVAAGAPPFDPATDLEAIRRVAGDLEILSIHAVAGGQTAPSPALTLRAFFPAPPDPERFPRDIDALLARYAIKHQKRRVGVTVQWDVASGHAKKTGLTRLVFQPADPALVLDLVHAVEPHLLAKLAPDADLEVVPAG